MLVLLFFKEKLLGCYKFNGIIFYGKWIVRSGL